LSLRSELIAMSGRFPLVQHHHIVASDWIDRFASRLGALLPGIDPTEASERGKASIPDAYECHPDQAAEIAVIYGTGLARSSGSTGGGGLICKDFKHLAASWVGSVTCQTVP